MRATASRRGSQASGSSKSPSTRVVVTLMGVAILVVGLILLYLGFSEFFEYASNLSPFRPPIGFSWFILSSAGGLLMVFGVSLIYLANIRWLYSYVSSGVTEGVRRGGGLLIEEVRTGVPSRSSETVKVRCRNCNALNDEDDEYCGKCGQRL